MTNRARLKLLTFTLVAFAMGWVIADAFDWSPLNSAPLPTVTELVATAASAESQLDIVERLQATPADSEASVDLLATCLMQESRELRQAARSVAHERLDEWQLDSAAHQHRLVTHLSGSLRRLLQRTNGNPTNRELTIEAREIATRIIKTAKRASFTDGQSCLNDCHFVLSFAPPASQPARLPDVLQQGLRNALVAPVSYEAEVAR